MFNPKFNCGGLELSRVWHCFGNYMHRVNIQDVLSMLNASQSNIIPINTHLLDKTSQREGLIIGFGEVTFDSLKSVFPVDDKVLMLNINHQTTAKNAIDKTLLAYQITSEKVVKIEVLSENMKMSNNAELIKAIEKLNQVEKELILMPLMHCNYEDAKKFIDLGCPLLRVMGSPIGSGAGILDTREFQKICQLDVPVVIDGGVGSSTDFNLAVDLGADGCLVNSMLFEAGNRPAQELKRFMEESQPILSKFEYMKEEAC